ncbi:MAG: ATP-binding protein [Thomasclavelia ramosa]
MVVGKDFLEEINNDFMIIAKNNHKDLVLEAKIVSKQLYLDKQIIFKILENLLNNAFRFANNGVKLTIMETVGYLEFVIQDDGPGFSKRI